MAGARPVASAGTHRKEPDMADPIIAGVCHIAFFADPAGNKLMVHARYAPRGREDA
jgi:hypothetical protein